MSNILKIAGAGVSAAEETDEYFNQTVLLLHGDGTNGAQNNTFLDSSTNNFTITRNGNTTQGTFSPFSVGEGEWSNYFDGNDDLRIAASTGSWADFGTDDFTIFAWVYVPSVSALQGICGAHTAAQNNTWQFRLNGSALELFGANQALASTTAVAANQWVFVTASRSGANAYLGVNGTVNTVAITAGAGGLFSATSGGNVSIGNLYSTPSNYWLTGYISGLTIIKGTALFTSSFTPSTSPASTNTTNQQLLTCYGNRFADFNTATTAKTITVNGNPKVTPFSPFAPTAAYDASVNGGSGYFDGSGDYLTLTDASNDLDLGGVQASVDFWAYVPDSTVQYTAIQKGNSNSYNLTDGFSYSVTQITSTWTMFYNNAGSGASITGTAPAANQWTHICAATDTSNNIALFINGTRVATASNAISKPTTRTGIKIGEALSNAGDWSGYMSGLRFLTGANAYDPTDTTITIPTAPPTAVSGTELLLNFTNAGIFDQTGKNNLETVADAQIDTTTKKYGTGSMEFDGTGDALHIVSNPDLYLSTGNFTIEGWVYTTDSTVSQTIMVKRAAQAARGFIVVINSFVSQKLGFACGDTNISAWEVQLNSTTSLANNTWYHFAVVRDGNDFELFINGVSEDTANSSVVIADDTSLLRIGLNDVGAAGLNGYLDDLRITKGVARYTSNFTAPTKAFPDL